MAIELPDGRRYSFTQPLCTNCWLAENTVVDPEPEAGGSLMFKAPVVLKYDAVEWPDRLAKCCKCGRATTSGIFIRVDPHDVPHPTPEEE